MQGFRAANFHKVTISSQSEEHAFIEAWEFELTCLVDGPRAEFKATLVLNHQTYNKRANIVNHRKNQKVFSIVRSTYYFFHFEMIHRSTLSIAL